MIINKAVRFISIQCFVGIFFFETKKKINKKKYKRRLFQENQSFKAMYFLSQRVKEEAEALMFDVFLCFICISIDIDSLFL